MKRKRNKEDPILQRKSKPIFILLKVVEILSVLTAISLSFLLGKLMEVIGWLAPHTPLIELWIKGLGVFVASAIVLSILYLIIRSILNLNRGWAINIAKNIKKK